MQRDNIVRVAAKELTLFFSSAIGYLFIAVFLIATLFVFFWMETFFARNIADVRPMFERLPLLMIFLSAALTMRMWSEERRTGTLEFVVTVPVSTWSFVLGKFVACWLLLLLALLLTLPLPITISTIANLDWGPVVAGYLAAALLGGAYIAIGLFVSALSNNQIVSLILATLACAAFYLVGSAQLTDLVGNDVGNWLRAIGSGSRFESITRGVLDVRDLYFYVSVIVAFLAFNVYALEHARWAHDGARQRHRAWQIGTGLLVLNVLIANFWIGGLSGLRYDATQGKQYSISESTRTYLAQLREPLLIRGYFSGKTHPLLAPLVPEMKDLLSEFAVAGKGKVHVEFVDPVTAPEAEDEANSKYGIRPVPFQVADRYQSSLVNSYFDVLVQYGDEFQVLSFRDLIEVKVYSEERIDVLLRNPEYDITRAIRKVMYGFQSGGDLYESIATPVKFTGYLSDPAKLPPALVDFRKVVNEVVGKIAEDSKGKVTMEIVDPEAGDAAVAKDIATRYGFRPMAASLFDVNTFYFYLTLGNGTTVVQIPLPDDLGADALKRGVETGLKRFATGYLKTVAYDAPSTPPFMAQQGMAGPQFNELATALSADLHLERSDLADGHVPAAAQALVVVSPEELSDKQLFAIDQFLMEGGTVVLATSPFATTLSQQTLIASERKSGLEPWLKHHGVVLEPKLVMDPHNAAFPAPVTRQMGGFSFQEIRMLDYPYFVDIRNDGLADSPITSDLPQVTMPWASPITIDADKNKDRDVTELLKSSPDSWTSASTNVMPRIDAGGGSSFLPEGDVAPRVLAVSVTGAFTSYFADKPNPLLAVDAEKKEEDPAKDDEKESKKADESKDAEQKKGAGVVSGVIDRSPESARLVVFASNDFLSDQTLGVLGSASGSMYGNSLQLVANTVDVALEDQGLLAIRSRGHFNRTLPPLEENEQRFWEYLNYGLALLGLVLVLIVHRMRTRTKRARYAAWLAPGNA
jgi:ABC-2 type transport system permease protein